MTKSPEKTVDIQASGDKFFKDPLLDGELSGYISRIHEEIGFCNECDKNALSLLEESGKERQVAATELENLGCISLITRQLLQEILKEFKELDLAKLPEEVKPCVADEVSKIEEVLGRMAA